MDIFESDLFHPWIISSAAVIVVGLIYIIRRKGRERIFSLMRIIVGVVGGMLLGAAGAYFIALEYDFPFTFDEVENSK